MPFQRGLVITGAGQRWELLVEGKRASCTGSGCGGEGVSAPALENL